ncbi:MAG TPA: hypothetical protein VFL88_11405 [Gemmatimonadales bacterium]|jgi:hypothetical protein|nr:hypothetical protein [Gemmatimonadales bacterium]
MIRLLRRARSVALALLLMSPGLGGMAVQAFHPCPSHMVMQGAGMHHAAGDAHDAPSDAHSYCHCIGSCAAAAVQASPRDGRMLAVLAAPHAAPVAETADRPASQLPLDRLPPSTAPPLTPLIQA